ncbi:MAG: D-alanyl-D-alanine carboxypeptidase family protein [Ornithinibacter sp.]
MALVTASVLFAVLAPGARADEPAAPTPSASSAPTPSPSPSPSQTPTTPRPTRSADPGPSVTSGPARGRPQPTIQPGDGEPDHLAPLSGVFLEAQIAEADRISAALAASNSRVGAATREMDRLAEQSNALLESLSVARETERAATDEADGAREELVVLEGRLAAARQVVREWVFSVYAGGGGDSDFSGMLDAMSADTDQVGDPLGDLSYLTEQRTRALADIKVLTAEQVRLSASADAARARAEQARTDIETDKTALDEVVRTQRSRVAQLLGLQVAEVEKAGPVAGFLVGARTDKARAASQRLRDALGAAGVDTTSIGKPCTDDTTVYPNGMLPDSALCPVWGAPGEQLSPAGAASFNALSQAYAAQSGVPLCVTDSYRSLPDQISIKATRGRFAATPGTSQHGLGRAVDLCGGVESFGSAAHRWMRQNAPLYGWFHPSWADAGGRTPEPWHFEFAG